jgi:hypothetical protein
MRRSRIAVAVVAGLLGCVPTVTFAVVASSGSYYRCDDVRVVAEVLSHNRPASDLRYVSRTALDAPPADPAGERLHLGDLADWTVIADDEHRVAVVQPHIGPLPAATRGATWLDLAVAERVGPLGRSGRPTWRVRPLELCVMHRELPAGVTWADVGLDPTRPARPTDTVVHLLVRPTCSGPRGEAVTQRVDVEDGEAVGVLVGAPPRGAGGRCDPDAAAPVTVALERPLGHRTLVDPRFYPPVPLAPLRQW